MTDSSWLDEWGRAWQALAGDGQATPWAVAVDQFTEASRKSLPPSFAETLDKLNAQSRAFLELGQQLSGNDATDWQQSVFKYLDHLADSLREPANAVSLAGMPQLDYWRRFAGHGNGSAGDQKPFLPELDRLLRTPGLGLTRERQEALQELSRRWLAYEQAHGEYLAYCAETARLAAERLRGRLADQFEQDAGPGSVRELYDAWVACSEEVHEERVASDVHMKCHGRMINAFMAYRQQLSRLVDQLAESANVPTRAEVDALHRKIRALQKEVRELRARQGLDPDLDQDQGAPPDR